MAEFVPENPVNTESNDEATLSDQSLDDEAEEEPKPTRKKRECKKKINIFFLLRNILATREMCIDWLKNQGFIPKIIFCTSCKKEMQFIPSKQAIDGYVWICKDCPNSELSARHGSWLDGRDAPLNQVLIFTFWWALGCTNEQLARETCLDMEKVEEWNNAYLDICASVLDRGKVDDDFLPEDDLDKKMSYAATWRRKNKNKDLFLEFLKMADSL